jgi:hypothetical protein
MRAAERAGSGGRLGSRLRKQASGASAVSVWEPAARISVGASSRCLKRVSATELVSMRARPGEHEDLRLAARGSDRATAAQQEWPAFEKRLTQLGYTPLSIAYAFSILSGPGTVAEALAALERKSV